MGHRGLEIQQREKEGIVILDLKGHLVMGGGDIALREFVQGLFDPGNRRLILDFAQTVEIDTAGMGVLLLLAQQYSGDGGRMVLFNIAHTHGHVYEMARLEAAIEIYRDELDAVNSFFPDRVTVRYDILEYVEKQHHEDHSEKS
jgi:anti-sigma B factor antagonist